MASRVSTANVDSLNVFANPNPKHSQPLRRGTWTTEEEQYVAALIEEFKHGQLPLKEGISLRCFLAKMVHCNPKRISKKFEGSNYNGKQLYEQSDQDLDRETAQLRRAKLQDLENKFEESVTVLKASDDSRKAGIGQPLTASTGLFPHRQMLPGAAGLAGAGILNTEASWLRGSMGMMPGRGMPFGGMGMSGMNGFPSMAGAFDPALFQGYIDPMPPIGLNAGALRDMVRLSDYGRLPAASDLTGEFGTHNPAMSTNGESKGFDRSLANLGLGVVAGGGPRVQQGANFPTLLNNASAAASDISLAGSGPSSSVGNVQDMFFQQQLIQAQQQELHENRTRLRLMGLLSQPESAAESQAKRPSLLAGGNDDSKRRRMC